jgi:hypothetical protein
LWDGTAYVAISDIESVSTMSSTNKLLTEKELQRSIVSSDYAAFDDYYGVINANDNAYELMTSDSTLSASSGYISSIKIKCGASVAGDYSITFMTAALASKTLGAAVTVTDNITIPNITMTTNEQTEIDLSLVDRTHTDGLNINTGDYLFVGFLSSTTTPYIKLARGFKAQYPDAQVIGTNAQDLAAPTVSFVGASGAQTYNHLMMEYSIILPSGISSYNNVLENTTGNYDTDNLLVFDNNGQVKDSGKDLDDLEQLINKVTAVTFWATDTQYPTAKAVRSLFPTTAGNYTLHVADDGALSWVVT